MSWALNIKFAQAGQELLADTPIPDHAGFPLYAPSFTMEVPAGNMRDENTDDYLREVEDVYSQIILRLRERCSSEHQATLNSKEARQYYAPGVEIA